MSCTYVTSEGCLCNRCIVPFHTPVYRDLWNEIMWVSVDLKKARASNNPHFTHGDNPISLSCKTNVLETKSWSSTAGQPAVAQWEQHVHLEHVREVQSLYVLNISIFFFANFFLVCAINNKTSLKRAHWPRGTTRTTTTIESCWRAVSMYRHLAGEMPCKWGLV